MKRQFSMAFGGCGVLLVALLATRADAKKMIIQMVDFAPVGQVTATGHQVKLQLLGKPTVVPDGDQTTAIVTVVQTQTGAMAVGGGPIGKSNLALAHALPGSPPFQPGPAVATSKAFHLRQGKVIRTWTWTSNVTLVKK